MVDYLKVKQQFLCFLFCRPLYADRRIAIGDLGDPAVLTLTYSGPCFSRMIVSRNVA
jgi:hypothetical protein